MTKKTASDFLPGKGGAGTLAIVCIGVAIAQEQVLFVGPAHQVKDGEIDQ
jgi:hypothetical protein